MLLEQRGAALGMGGGRWVPWAGPGGEDQAPLERNTGAYLHGKMFLFEVSSESHEWRRGQGGSLSGGPGERTGAQQAAEHGKQGHGPREGQPAATSPSPAHRGSRDTSLEGKNQLTGGDCTHQRPRPFPAPRVASGQRRALSTPRRPRSQGLSAKSAAVG